MLFYLLPVILYEKGHGLHFFMSSDFVDEHHNKIEKDGFYFDDRGHLETRDESRVFYDISITKNGRSREWGGFPFLFRGYGFAWEKQGVLTLTLNE